MSFVLELLFGGVIFARFLTPTVLKSEKKGKRGILELSTPAQSEKNVKLSPVAVYQMIISPLALIFPVIPLPLDEHLLLQHWSMHYARRVDRDVLECACDVAYG